MRVLVFFSFLVRYRLLQILTGVASCWLAQPTALAASCEARVIDVFTHRNDDVSASRFLLKLQNSHYARDVYFGLLQKEGPVIPGADLLQSPMIRTRAGGIPTERVRMDQRSTADLTLSISVRPGFRFFDPNHLWHQRMWRTWLEKNSDRPNEFPSLLIDDLMAQGVPWHIEFYRENSLAGWRQGQGHHFLVLPDALGTIVVTPGARFFPDDQRTLIFHVNRLD